jgi:hypothetical protein
MFGTHHIQVKRENDPLKVSADPNVMYIQAMAPSGQRRRGPVYAGGRPGAPVLLDGNAKLIELVDIKETRSRVMTDWRAFKPELVVKLFRQHYGNLQSASVMLSRFKADLRILDDPPTDEFLSKLALSKKEYAEIRASAQDTRRKGALDVQTISNGDSVVTQALQYITSSDPSLLYAALLPLTGLRPVEIFKTAMFRVKLNNEQEKKAFWACQTRFAKRGNMKTAYNTCRDRPFLTPYWLIERALKIVRERWPCAHLSNRELSRKYSSAWQKIVTKAYPQLPGCNARLFRRFFAVYSYSFFGKSVFANAGGMRATQTSLNGYASWVLGHHTLEDQVIAYSSLIVRPAPKLKLFKLGQNLKVFDNLGSAEKALSFMTALKDELNTAAQGQRAMDERRKRNAKDSKSAKITGIKQERDRKSASTEKQSAVRKRHS